MDLIERRILRKTTLARRDALPADERGAMSLEICGRLLKLDMVRQATSIFIYMHFRSEVQTMECVNQCLAAGKAVSIPFTLKDEKRLVAVHVSDPFKDVTPGYCGIPEPREQLIRTSGLNPAEINVVVIPGSVFDPSGSRLGYGGGYYDRFLVHEAPRALRVGLAFEIQVIEKVPVQSHDQFMDLIVTEENIYDCRRIRDAQDSSLS